jgi:integrase
MAVPMANDPPFATLNHFGADLGIPSESDLLRIGISQSRPVLFGSRPPTNALWISSTTGKPLTEKNIGTLISKITFETLGVDVSPHLFRTAAASTAAAYGGKMPHLASALLNHTDPRVTEEHYNRASSVTASKIYAEIINSFLRD